MPIAWRKLTGESGDKYELCRAYVQQTPLRLCVPSPHTCGLVTIHLLGALVIRPGYRWDGASGPAIDFRNMRASLVHDACYELLRDGCFGNAGSKSWAKARKQADQMYRDIMIEEGAWKVRAAYQYWALRVFAGRFAK